MRSAGVPAGAGAASARRAGEEQEKAGGRQQIYSGESGGDGKDEEWSGRPHQKVSRFLNQVICKDDHTIY